MDVRLVNKIIFFSFLCFLWLTAGYEYLTKKSSQTGQIIVATTTSLYDTGLLDQLIAIFEKSSTLKVKAISVGTGEALKMGERGEADLLLVHSPELEKEFMANGHGLERREFTFSRFVLVGPQEDPAQVKGLPFPSAFAQIAKAKSPYISRADNSGTHFLEKKIWEKIGVKIFDQWYLESVQSMAEALMMAAEKRAYLLSDYPTYCQLRKKIDLAIMSIDKNYLNIYSAIIPKKTRLMGNETGAKKFLAFLLSEQAQTIMNSFGFESLAKESP